MALAKGATVPVNPHVKEFGVAIAWDKGPVEFDVDLQALAVDNKGTIVDAVYYNNLKALSGALVHSGDETTGEKAGLDEIVWTSLKKLPQNIKMIVFVVAAYARGSLKDAQNGRIVILEDEKGNQTGVFQMEKSKEEVDAVLTLVRSANGDFNIHVVEEPAGDGKHFMDILEPTIGNLIRAVIPDAPKRQKVAFAMNKGAVVDLPDVCKMEKITAGLGWDASRVGGSIDLDVSVVCFGNGNHVGAVYFGNKKEFGIEHSGDNLTGAGSGDDEVIKIDLGKIPPNVDQLLFSVHIYTRGVSFEKVSNAYCRVCDDSGQELARYNLSQGRGQSGLVIARLFKEPHANRWGFQAIGSFIGGNTWKDSVGDMTPLVRLNARQFQMQHQHSMASSPGVQGQVVQSRANDSADPACCSLQ